MRPALIPTRASVWALAALALACAVALVAGARMAWVAAGAATLAVALLVASVLDVALTLRAWRAAPLQWQRRLPAAFALGVPRVLAGTLVNEGRCAWRVALFDHIDPSFDFDGLPQTLAVPAEARLELHYRVTPRRRGPVVFEPAALRLRTRFGLFELLLRAGVAESRRVYPNFAAVSRYAWLAGDHRLAEIGIKAAPQRGAGTDFKQLADYTPGASVRHIDWKATLRHQRPIVREYQDERDQSVLFLLDCGRRMRADDGAAANGAGAGAGAGLGAGAGDSVHAGTAAGAHTGTAAGAAVARTSHFDDALNALMLLAHVALKEGDAVGAMTFGTEPGNERHFAPRKGSRSLNALMATLYDIEPRATHSDYLMAASRLMHLQRKRALVVVLTNFRDEDSAELGPALRLLRTRHLVLVASLRERALRELAEQRTGTDAAAIEVAGAHLFAQARHDAFVRLAQRDALLIDVEPAQLPAQLVNRYRAVKRAGLL